jgi:MtN3 and saliva related transmembrane protein
MYVTISVAFVLWLGYGLTIGSWPMIVFNLMNLALGGVILILKIRGNRSQAQRPGSSSLEAEAP